MRANVDKNQNLCFGFGMLLLRKNNPALRAGDEAATNIRLKTNAENSVLAYLRKNVDREVMVLLNLSKQPVHCTVDGQQLSGKFTEVFSKTKHDFTTQKSFELKPWAYQVYEK